MGREGKMWREKEHNFLTCSVIWYQSTDTDALKLIAGLVSTV